jgi:hypothetical protein
MQAAEFAELPKSPKFHPTKPKSGLSGIPVAKHLRNWKSSALYLFPIRDHPRLSAASFWVFPISVISVNQR